MYLTRSEMAENWKHHSLNSRRCRILIEPGVTSQVLKSRRCDRCSSKSLPESLLPDPWCHLSGGKQARQNSPLRRWYVKRRTTDPWCSVVIECCVNHTIKSGCRTQPLALIHLNAMSEVTLPWKVEKHAKRPHSNQRPFLIWYSSLLFRR